LLQHDDRVLTDYIGSTSVVHAWEMAVIQFSSRRRKIQICFVSKWKWYNKRIHNVGKEGYM